MQKFLKENWLRILSLVFTAIVAVIAFYFAYVLNQKSLPDLQPKSLNANKISDNQNANVAQTDDFICPEDYIDTEKYVGDLISQMEKLKNENADITVDEVIKIRQKQLVKYKCEETLFDMDTSHFSENLKFMGKDFGPKTIDLDKDTKFRSLIYPLAGQKPKEAEEEIVISFYLPEVWSKQFFTVQDVATKIVKRQINDGFNFKNKFKEKEKNKDNLLYLTTATKIYPGGKYGDIYIELYGKASQGGVYSLSFIKTLQDQNNLVEKRISTWLKKNNSGVLKALKFFIEEDNADSEETLEDQDPTFNNGIIELQQKEDPVSQ